MIGYYEQKGYRGSTHIVAYNTEAFSEEARLTLDLVGRWGMVAGVPDGEDTAGRSKVRLSTPEELVVRAISTTKLIFDAIRKQGWATEIPAPKPEQLEEK